jgi:hypothetical protein
MPTLDIRRRGADAQSGEARPDLASWSSAKRHHSAFDNPDFTLYIVKLFVAHTTTCHLWPEFATSLCKKKAQE